MGPEVYILGVEGIPLIASIGAGWAVEFEGVWAD